MIIRHCWNSQKRYESDNVGKKSNDLIIIVTIIITDMWAGSGPYSGECKTDYKRK